MAAAIGAGPAGRGAHRQHGVLRSAAARARSRDLARRDSVSQSIRIGSATSSTRRSSMDVKREYKLTIGQQTAEEVKLEIGWPSARGGGAGRDPRPRPRLPACRDDRATSEEVRMALEEPLQAIIDAVKDDLDRTPPDLRCGHHGPRHHVAGGGALLQGRRALRDEDDMPAYWPSPRSTCVVVGSGRSLEEFEAIDAATRIPERAGGGEPPAPEGVAVHDRKAIRRRRAAPRSSSRFRSRSSRGYFGESRRRAFDTMQRALDRRSRRSRRARARRRKPFRDSSGGPGTRSTPRTRTSSSRRRCSACTDLAQAQTSLRDRISSRRS